MDNIKNELVKSWLVKAQHDLGSAKRLAECPDPYYDTAIYHCQQAVEKSFKAFLVYNDIVFEKIHNLTVLIELCTEVDSDFQDYLEAAAILTPYATAYRYPNELFELEPDEFQIDEALQLTQEILEFVMKHLPTSVHSGIVK